MCHLYAEPEKLIATWMEEAVASIISDIVKQHQGLIIAMPKPDVVGNGGVSWNYPLPWVVGKSSPMVPMLKKELHSLGLVLTAFGSDTASGEAVMLYTLPIEFKENLDV